jgi:hypothetical protein
MSLPRFVFSATLAFATGAALSACGSSTASPGTDDGTGDDTSVGGSGGTPGSGGSGGSGGAADGGKPAPAPEGGGGGALPKPSGPCAKLKFEESKTVAQTIGNTVDTDLFSWNDASCLPRTAAMARDDRGYLRQMTYQYDGKTRTVTGTGVNGWNGTGFIINHGMSNGAGKTGPTGYSAIFVGDHHAIYQYQSNVGTGIPVTRQWLIATGRDHPLFAVTFDTSARTPPVGADTRTPYGDMAWDGDESFPDTVVDGVGWGDHYKFVTTAAPLTLNSTWDYTKKNTVPYCLEWRESPDTEMGFVQTQTYTQHDAGGYWNYSNWGKTSANQAKKDPKQAGVMPVDFNWAYQLNQFELCYINGQQDPSCLDQTTNSHRIAWGANYGAVGGADAAGMYPAMGSSSNNLNAQPGQSYSVFMALGKHSTSTVATQVHEIEVVQGTTMTASVGTVVTTGPAGVGRTDTITYAPVGWDPRYATWNIKAEANKAAFSVTVAQDALLDPIVVVQGFTGTTVPAITVDGVAAVADVDFLASVDGTGQMLWITFRPGWSGTHQITIG